MTAITAGKRSSNYSCLVASSIVAELQRDGRCELPGRSSGAVQPCYGQDGAQWNAKTNTRNRQQLFMLKKNRA